MSMASMLGKMVVAGLVAKGVGKFVGGRSGGNSGGIAGALSGMLGSSGAAGALGGLLGGSGGGAGASGAGGGLGGLLNSLSGNSSEQTQGEAGGIGDLLASFTGDQSSVAEATADQNQQAEVLLRAMLNAAKADGDIDQAEQARILKHLDDVSPEEEQFLKTELSSPLDTEGFIRSVPRGMEQQVYLMSLTAIDLDSKVEAQYLHQLAQGLGIEQQVCNAIHEQVGAPKLYS